MPIIAVPQEYLGSKLYLRPGYGYGWSRPDDRTQTVDYGAIEGAGGFGVRVRLFFTYQKQWRGLLGVVEQEGHPFDGFWVGCTEMHAGQHNFTDRLCLRWDLDIGPDRPQGTGLPAMPGGTPRYHGYGILAETDADIDAHFMARFGVTHFGKR